jgi:hypothetical protein
MKKLPQCILLSLAFGLMLEFQADGYPWPTDNFRRIWQRCRDDSIQEINPDSIGLTAEYDLYRQFLEDRCGKIEGLWGKHIQIDIVPCGSEAAPTPVPHCVVDPIIIEHDTTIVFRIAWFGDYFGQDPPQEDMKSSFWRDRIIRPLLVTPPPLLFSLVAPLSVTSIPPLMPLSGVSVSTSDMPNLESIMKIFLTNRSRMLPSVILLHELTHLLLCMDFILAKNLEIDSCNQTESSFKEDFSKWIVEEVLCKIHPKFSESRLKPSSTAAPHLFSGFLFFRARRQQPEATTAIDLQLQRIVSLYQDCWGSRDEILVIIGVKLLLEGQEHLLGETMLLRRIAQLKGLPLNFICWSHCNAYLDSGVSLTPKDGRNNFYKDLFLLH